VSREIHRNRGERGYRFKQAEATVVAGYAVASIARTPGREGHEQPSETHRFQFSIQLFGQSSIGPQPVSGC
jgi:hypothetical protein